VVLSGTKNIVVSELNEEVRNAYFKFLSLA